MARQPSSSQEQRPEGPCPGPALPPHSPGRPTAEAERGPRNPGSGKEMDKPAWDPARLTPVTDAKSLVPWPEGGWPPTTHNGEVVVIRLHLIPIARIQRHRVHSQQHFGRSITLCQLLGSATACVWGQRYWIMTPNRPSAFHPAQTWVERSLGRYQLEREVQSLLCI